MRRIIAGQADPEDDAIAAAKRGRFDMALIGSHGAHATGVVCFTPYGQAPGALFQVVADAISPEVAALGTYAVRYNRTLVEQPTFPYPDLCRVAAQNEEPSWVSRRPSLDVIARPILRRPLTLHEAARFGDPADIGRWLQETDRNAEDAFGMTPLAWAVARDKPANVEVLLRAGADPLLEKPGAPRTSALHVAVALGRTELFDRLVAHLGRRLPQPWPRGFADAAIHSGDQAIPSRIATGQLDPTDHVQLRGPLPDAEMIEPFLRARTPKLADDLLVAAIDATDTEGVRLDLVRLALRHGADPNARSAGKHTALGLASRGFLGGSELAVDLLLRAGADIDLPSGDGHSPERPVWIAVGTLRLGSTRTEIDARAERIIKRLVRAGADLNLPGSQGKPPIWFLLVPYSHTAPELDGSFVTDALLTSLAQQGLDVNAEWEGRRVLALVEAQAGNDAPLARTLRRLGAR